MARLGKGANISLTRETPDLKCVTLGVECSADSEVVLEKVLIAGVLCDSSGKVLSSEDFVFWNQMQTRSNNVHMGDDLFQVHIDLPSVPESVEKIDLVAWVEDSHVNFSRLSSLLVRVLNADTGGSVISTEDYVSEFDGFSAVRLVSVYRYRGDWKIRNVCDGWVDGLGSMMKGYGV